MKIKMLVASIMATLLFPVASPAQKEFSVNGKFDVVSDYVWRGAYQGSGPSVQPSLTLSYAGVSLNAWGNQSLTTNAKEFDINLGYSIKGFSVILSDYWWSGVDKAYGDYSNDHFFEVSLSYQFGESFPLYVGWSTMVYGGDRNETGKQQFSSYLSMSYNIALPMDITLTPSIGFTPWKGMYYHQTALTDISLKANKDIKINDTFAIPFYVQAIVAPMYDRTYLVAGFSLGF